MYSDLIGKGCAQNGGDPLFIKSSYVHPQNKQTYPFYIMNRDGFSLLVMGFTGKEALEWKLQYIKAFNQMENFIREKSTQVWVETRKAGKLTRKAETDTIQKLVEYAKVQGSSQGQSSSSFGSNTTAKPQTVSNGQAVVNYAAQFVGNPYVYGGSSLTNGADCSGFVMSVYQAFGISLPHSSSALRSVGYGVSLDAIQPGDIVCYSGHVGIYAGNNTLLHASSPSTGIKYTSPVTYREILAIRRIF